ncbi:hypothetical protein AGLY_007346 [Aphis glycines]|uniref:Uncharacterized protein n=1 Tax=Aphis glycines TaxID=307491 RepID=A0A6G0TQJ7_APHGL|nr:hypothetical protein AGLY_007346 [Aphis glycines]
MLPLMYDKLGINNAFLRQEPMFKFFIRKLSNFRACGKSLSVSLRNPGVRVESGSLCNFKVRCIVILRLSCINSLKNTHLIHTSSYFTNQDRSYSFTTKAGMALMKPTNLLLLMTRTPTCHSFNHPGGKLHTHFRHWLSVPKTILFINSRWQSSFLNSSVLSALFCLNIIFTVSISYLIEMLISKLIIDKLARILKR